MARTEDIHLMLVCRTRVCTWLSWRRSRWPRISMATVTSKGRRQRIASTHQACNLLCQDLLFSIKQSLTVFVQTRARSTCRNYLFQCLIWYAGCHCTLSRHSYLHVNRMMYRTHVVSCPCRHNDRRFCRSI